MNLAYFIASRFIKKNKNNFSHSINKVAIIGIALGISVMILSVSVVTGFQKKITEKVIGFGGHIRISNFDNNQSYESVPIEKNSMLENQIKQINGVQHIQMYANKAGIIKTDKQIQGFILKGVGDNYDFNFIKKSLIEGNILKINKEIKTNEVLISKYLANLLELKINDKLRAYFIENDQLRGRAFDIAGIYETGLEEFDKKFVFADIAHIQKLNNWDTSYIEGYEVLISNIDDLDAVGKEVYNTCNYNLNTSTIKELHPEIFDWLGLTDMNVIVIIVIISLISSVTMVSILLILILDKTNLIGILKAMGTYNSTIREIFIINALYIIFKGVVLGNLIALGIGYIQQHFGLLKLDQASYYLKTVPVNMNIWHIIFINTGAILLCILTLLIPSYIISKIRPIKAIRYK